MVSEDAAFGEFDNNLFFDTLYDTVRNDLEKIRPKKRGFSDIENTDYGSKFLQGYLQFRFGQEEVTDTFIDKFARKISNAASFFIPINYVLLRVADISQDMALNMAQNAFINDAFNAAKGLDLRKKYSPEDLEIVKEPLDLLMAGSQEFKLNFDYKPEQFANFLTKTIYRALRKTHPGLKATLYNNLEVLNKYSLKQSQGM